MSTPTSNPAEIVRRTFLKIDARSVLSAVDSLDLRGSAKISAVVGVPLRNLQQRRDVEAFAISAPVPALMGLLEFLAVAPLEQVVVALGDHADNPTFEQLDQALATLLGNGGTVDDAVALLGFAIGESFPAASHCRRLLDERPEFELPTLPDAALPTSLFSPKQIDPLVREQRRARREEKKRKKGPTSARPVRPTKTKRDVDSPVSGDSVSVRDVSLTDRERRSIHLTPAELERFNPDHPIVGTVLLADVPFDAVDPATPEMRSKERPVLVVAASNDEILVRPIYSQSSPTRSTFLAWRRLGLDHVSYIDDARVALPVSSLETVKRLGQLSDLEWNALL